MAEHGRTWPAPSFLLPRPSPCIMVQELQDKYGLTTGTQRRRMKSTNVSFVESACFLRVRNSHLLWLNHQGSGGCWFQQHKPNLSSPTRISRSLATLSLPQVQGWRLHPIPHPSTVPASPPLQFSAVVTESP